MRINGCAVEQRLQRAPGSGIRSIKYVVGRKKRHATGSDVCFALTFVSTEGTGSTRIVRIAMEEEVEAIAATTRRFRNHRTGKCAGGTEPEGMNLTSPNIHSCFALADTSAVNSMVCI